VLLRYPRKPKIAPAIPIAIATYDVQWGSAIVSPHASRSGAVGVYAGAGRLVALESFGRVLVFLHYLCRIEILINPGQKRTHSLTMCSWHKSVTGAEMKKGSLSQPLHLFGAPDRMNLGTGLRFLPCPR